jgi:hypothetical protein
MSEKLGTEKIEKFKEAAKKLVIAGKKITADKKVDFTDIPHVMALIPEFPAIFEAIKGLSEAFNEVKDLDVSEVIALINKFDEAVKEIEAA